MDRGTVDTNEIEIYEGKIQILKFQDVKSKYFQTLGV